MVVSIDNLKEKYNNYAKPFDKIRHEVQLEHLFPIIRGLYETDKNAPGKCLASFICGPSYLSFDYALYYYSLIPETVYKTYTSATFNKRKIKTFKNFFGVYMFRDIPQNAYPFGISIKKEGEYFYQIATREKALCDKLYSLPQMRNVNELREMLFDDLRVDEDTFLDLDIGVLSELVPLYHSTNLNLLLKLTRRL